MRTMLPGATVAWVCRAVYALSPEPIPAAHSTWERDGGLGTGGGRGGEGRGGEGKGGEGRRGGDRIE